MAKQTYRFLLRMPEELRQRLAEAAERNGRSLNAELVDRLRGSLAPERPRVGRLSLPLPGLKNRDRGRLTRRFVVAGVVAAVLVAAGLAALLDDPPRVAAPPRGEGPPGLERMRQAVPGNFGMVEEGPAAAADAAFLERAYPDTTISVGEMEKARDAYAASSHRAFPKARKKPGRWASIGPSEALYPFTQFRNSSSCVPNAYVAGGRTTSLALNEARCTQSRCVMYITPAGGGVWRTNHALRGKPDWRYLGAPLGINAAGAVTIDPQTPAEWCCRPTRA